MDFSELLETRLRALRMTQKDFAEQLGTSEANISRIKKGETSRTNPKPKFVNKMATLLRVSYQDIYESLTGERPEDIFTADEPRQATGSTPHSHKHHMSGFEATAAIDRALPLLLKLKEKAKTEENRGIVQQVIDLISPEWDLQEIVDSFGTNRKKRLTSLKTLIMVHNSNASALSFGAGNDKKYLAGEMTDREYYNACLNDIELSFSDYENEMGEKNDKDDESTKGGGA